MCISFLFRIAPVGLFGLSKNIIFVFLGEKRKFNGFGNIVSYHFIAPFFIKLDFPYICAQRFLPEGKFRQLLKRHVAGFGVYYVRNTIDRLASGRKGGVESGCADLEVRFTFD